MKERPVHHRNIVDALDELVALDEAYAAADKGHAACAYATREYEAAFRARAVAKAARDQGHKNVAECIIASHFTDAHIRTISADGERRGEAYGREQERIAASAARHKAYEEGVQDERKRHAAKGWAS